MLLIYETFPEYQGLLNDQVIYGFDFSPAMALITLLTLPISFLPNLIFTWKIFAPLQQLRKEIRLDEYVMERQLTFALLIQV